MKNHGWFHSEGQCLCPYCSISSTPENRAKIRPIKELKIKVRKKK